ncbi:hypothetical protein [Streptomyces sp. NPDC017991]|uniref:hypothetical protein n=1 Tax=Streptomyces sp. NPDC017991 TaxID=3365026 RepID=UPI0037BBF130
MKTYQIEIKDTDKTVVKRFNFQSDKDSAYEIFSEWGGYYDSSHKLELSNWRTGELLPEGRQSGFSEWMNRDLTEWVNEFVAWT